MTDYPALDRTRGELTATVEKEHAASLPWPCQMRMAYLTPRLAMTILNCQTLGRAIPTGSSSSKLRFELSEFGEISGWTVDQLHRWPHFLASDNALQITYSLHISSSPNNNGIADVQSFKKVVSLKVVMTSFESFLSSTQRIKLFEDIFRMRTVFNESNYQRKAKIVEKKSACQRFFFLAFSWTSFLFYSQTVVFKVCRWEKVKKSSPSHFSSIT